MSELEDSTKFYQTHNEYKDVLFNNEFLIHSMNRIQSKNHRIRTCQQNEVNKISLLCFDDKICLQYQS